MQNENGPCPLLSVCNVLLLRGKFNIAPDKIAISYEDLVQTLANIVVDNTRASFNEHRLKSIDDLSSLLPSLYRGLDVNVIFRDIRSFEFTPALSGYYMLYKFKIVF
jgi:hypothetical protein